MEKLISARIQARAEAAVKAKSKDKAETKKDNEQKQKVELEEDGFKIPPGTAHHTKKKLEADEHLKIVERILQRDLDPTSGYLVDIVKVRHELSPYGLSDREWRCYLLYLVNQDPKKLILPQLASRLVKELETKISEVELTIDLEKDPLSIKMMKEAKLYFVKMKQERFKIKFLVDCFPVYSAKLPREKSGSSDSDSGTKHQDRRASRSSIKGDIEVKTDRDRSMSRQREQVKSFPGS